MDAAQSEIELREAVAIYDALPDLPPRLNVAENDATYAANNAHTTDRHGPAIPLRGRNTGTITIEGRIYGDPPWRGAENRSFRWISESVMNRTINDHIRDNWDDIRSELALSDRNTYRKTFDAEHLVGEGFYNEGMYRPGHPRVARYVQASEVTITLRLIPGTPPHFFLLTAFPTFTSPAEQ
ncbi:hypothetical protein [Streptomyces sp. RFCAC02]|uniref:hypothetical protein n=1 Tax=Streptomyces sp. RFCAC02 TaxID=2499143 RepID=UPI0010225127|nr:hypothetical protein [Streptomyces sp. RFCAC02]